MRYFFLKYTDNIPAEFGGESYGPLIKLRPKYADDQGLLEHEKVHVRQWYVMTAAALASVGIFALLVSPSLLPLAGLAPACHTLLYKFGRPYRQWCEVRAYRKQIAYGGEASSAFAVTALVEKYDLHLDWQEATALLVR